MSRPRSPPAARRRRRCGRSRSSSPARRRRSRRGRPRPRAARRGLPGPPESSRRSPQVKMCVGKEGQREPRTRSSCSTRSTSVGHRDARDDVAASTASIASRAIRHACAISSSSVVRLDAPQLVDERRALVELAPRAPPRAARSPSPPRPAARARSAVGEPISPTRLRERLRARRRRPRRRACRGGASPSRWKRDEHPRQHVDRLLAGREKRARDPAVRVGDVARRSAGRARSPSGTRGPTRAGRRARRGRDGRAAHRAARAVACTRSSSMPIRRPPSTRPSRGRATRAPGRRGRAG